MTSTRKISATRIRQIIREELSRTLLEAPPDDDFDDLVSGRKKVPGWITKDELREIVHELTDYVVRAYYNAGKVISPAVENRMKQMIESQPAYLRVAKTNYEESTDYLNECLQISHYSGPYTRDLGRNIPKFSSL